MSYLFELFSLELSLKRVISGDVRFRSVVSITLSLLDVKKAAGIESTRTVPVDFSAVLFGRIGQCGFFVSLIGLQ